ncbi:MAG: ribose 5-phosphate isomerase B [Rhodospirillaceae bacterium]|nr:MAG: ribose 5-phosphate isomerase B [Rhodospirillaceae bacterium]
MSEQPANLLARPGDTVAVASDHAGYDLKTLLAGDLKEMGFKVLDLGANGLESVDYPDFGAALGQAVARGRAQAGVAICGTGIGISIAANRIPGVRAALVHDKATAALSREHNDANVLALGARLLPPEEARAFLKIFLATPFGGGRHAGRVAKLG